MSPDDLRAAVVTHENLHGLIVGMGMKIEIVGDSEVHCLLHPIGCRSFSGQMKFADAAHLGQFRADGKPYITHPIAVAGLVADWRLDAQAVMAALMHDAMEDCGITKPELIERFGAPTADLVDGLTKLDKLQFNTREESQAESFRKMLLAMARDVRVILIKLADRTHNMRTIDAVMSDERLRGVPKLAIFDEGWSLVASEFGGAFIERAVRTYRSLGGTVGFITQDPRDLDTTMGRAVLGNTATKVVLPLDPNVAGTLSNYMDLNTAEASAIASLRLVKGIYSEFFVKMAGVGATVARLVPFPLLYAMNTTSPDDEAEQYRMLGEGLSCREMLERFAAQYPRGVFAAESSGQGVL